MKAVRYRHREVSGKHYDEQTRIALIAKTGRKFAYLVVIDFPVRVLQVPVTDAEKYSTEIDMTPAECARRMLDAGERMGINVTAERLLKEALT